MIDPSSFERVSSIDSTSSELMRRPFEAVPRAPFALMADVQEAGRGRGGRSWLTDAARSIALSVAVERAADGASLLGLPLAIGVAVADALAACGAAPRLKWPNDLLVETAGGLAKAGGILVEVRQQGALQRVVAGVGLNLAPGESLDADRVGQPVGALFAVAAMPDRERLARDLADAIAAVVPRLARDGLRPWLARWRELDALADHPVELLSHADGRRTPGIARGVDDDGALRVERPDGTIDRVISGEIGVRRRD
jgi:BirA family biotin operon repressor/biotin-[acetyl-CoA-carboxylase] ligase